MSEAPGKIATVLTDAILTESSVVFINNHFSVCHKPLVDFLSAEIVVFDSSVKLYGVLGNGGGLVALLSCRSESAFVFKYVVQFIFQTKMVQI